MKGNIYLSVTQHESFLHWQLQRPERRNALGPTLGQALRQALDALQSELKLWQEQNDLSLSPPYRGLVLSADVSGSNAPSTPVWIAGGDLKELAQLSTPQEGRAYATSFATIGQDLQNLPIPVIAAIDGLVIGGGVEFALAADLRISTQRSAFHFKQLEVGLSTGYASCQRLVALVGEARATDLLLLRRCLSSSDAKAYGLLNEVVEDQTELIGLLNSWEKEFSALSPWSLAAQKRMLQGRSALGRDVCTEKELTWFEELWMHPWHRRFLQKFLK